MSVLIQENDARHAGWSMFRFSPVLPTLTCVDPNESDYVRRVVMVSASHG